MHHRPSCVRRKAAIFLVLVPFGNVEINDGYLLRVGEVNNVSCLGLVGRTEEQHPPDCYSNEKEHHHGDQNRIIARTPHCGQHSSRMWLGVICLVPTPLAPHSGQNFVFFTESLSPLNQRNNSRFHCTLMGARWMSWRSQVSVTNVSLTHRPVDRYRNSVRKGKPEQL